MKLSVSSSIITSVPIINSAANRENEHVCPCLCWKGLLQNQYGRGEQNCNRILKMSVLDDGGQLVDFVSNYSQGNGPISTDKASNNDDTYDRPYFNRIISDHVSVFSFDG